MGKKYIVHETFLNIQKKKQKSHIHGVAFKIRNLVSATGT